VLGTAFYHKRSPRRRQADDGGKADPSELEPLVTSHHHRVFNWRNVVVGGGGAFLVLFGFAGLYVVIQDRGRSFVPAEAEAVEAAPAVAVLPFDVSASELDHLRDGMVVLLSMNLEGISGIRPISSMTMLAQWQEEVPEGDDPDLETALDIAESTGARYAVVGSAVGAGTMVRLLGQVYDVSAQELLDQVQTEGVAGDSLLGLMDEFTSEILLAIGGIGPGDLSRIDLRNVTTGSPEALRAYLRGEAHFRRGDFTAAAPEYDLAISEDSTFAAAHFRLGMAVGWSPLDATRGGEQVEHMVAARRHTRSERLDLLSRAWLAYLASQWSRPVAGLGSDEAAEVGGALRDAVRRHPDDAELTYLLGEYYFHGALTGMIDDAYGQAEEAFRRAGQLVPDFVPYTLHLGDLAWWRADSLSVLKSIEKIHRLAPGSWSDRVNQLLLGATFHADEGQTEAILDELDQLGAVQSAYYHLGHPKFWSFDEQVIERRFSTMGQHDCNWWGHSLGTGRLDRFLDDAANYEGRYRPWCFRIPQMLGLPVPPEQLDSELGEVSRSGWNSALYAADMVRWTDYEAALAAGRDTIRLAIENGDSVKAADWEEGQRLLKAYGEWKLGRPDELLEALEQLPPWYRSRDDYRWWLAMLYMELDQPADAARQLESFRYEPRWTLPLYHLGTAYDQLGETEKARAAYAEFVEAWKDADPELQPWVERGREALARLGSLDQ
jgi:tetratricopeptide (TPR) repeat protein